MSNRGIIISTSTKLITEECCACGVLFAMPADMQQRFSERGGYFYCPNGHAQHYIETDVMRLKHKLDQREAELERVYGDLDGALKEVTNKKRQITRMKNRAKNGVCPECRRHFNNLEEHMKTCHGTPQEKEAVKKRHKPA